MTLEPKYISKEQLEEKARCLILSWQPHLLEADTEPVDIDSFAEFELAATIDYGCLSPDGKVLGMSTFQDLDRQLRPVASLKVDIHYPANTIVIDHDALASSPEGRRRFTVAHECAHLLLHKRYFYRDPEMKSPNTIAYRPFTVATEEKQEVTFDRFEWQANYLGAAILMPAPAFTAAYRKRVSGDWHDLTGTRKRVVINELAERFDVSREAVAIRICNLKIA